MITPEPLPWACWLLTSIVTTLAWILAAAALIEPSIFAADGAVWVFCGRLLTTVVLPLLSKAATVPAPMPPPTRAAVTAAMTMVRERPDRGCSGSFGPAGPVGPPGPGGSTGPNGPNEPPAGPPGRSD